MRTHPTPATPSHLRGAPPFATPSPAHLKRSWRWAVKALAAAVAVVLVAACGASPAEPDPATSMPTTTAGTFVPMLDDPMGPATESLRDMNGNDWQFGQVDPNTLQLVYFGYTRCPDVCPTTLADVAFALQNLDPADADRIEVVLVSTDPHRDTAKQLRRWLGGLDESFIGVRGPIEKVIAAAHTYGIAVEAPIVSDDAYEVSHGAQLVALAPGGHMIGFFRELSGADTYIEQLPTILEQLDDFTAGA